MSWDALLKKTKVNLELLTDIDMHLFIEKGHCSGVCMVSKRFSKANIAMAQCARITIACSPMFA